MQTMRARLRKPGPGSKSDNVMLAGLLTAALLARIALTWRVLPDGLFDDAYTTLRYAANLANGSGFVYNPGERVWGTTTPLFTLLLAVVGRLVGIQYLD